MSDNLGSGLDPNCDNLEHVHYKLVWVLSPSLQIKGKIRVKYISSVVTAQAGLFVFAGKTQFGFLSIAAVAHIHKCETYVDTFSAPLTIQMVF